MSDSQTDGAGNPRFRLGRVLLVVIPLGVLASAGAIGWGYFDVPVRFQRWMLPPLVEVTGRVYLNSKPLQGAEVATLPVDIQASGGMAMTDDEGRFSLRTNVQGDWFSGAYLGEHRVTIARPDPSIPAGPFKPPTITPPESEDFEKTPLRLTVDRDPSRNQCEFRLEYTVPPRPAGKGKRPPMGAGKMGGKGPPGISKMRGKTLPPGEQTSPPAEKTVSPPEKATPSAEKTSPPAQGNQKL